MNSLLKESSVVELKWMEQFCRNLLLKKLDKLQYGKIELRESFQAHPESQFFGTNSDLNVTLDIFNPRAYSRIVLGGSIGAGESYMDADWESSDLTGLIQIFVRNRELLEDLDSGWGSVTTPIQKLLHKMNRNSIEGSRKNISAHYDLSNEFFSLFLDPTFMYSSAVFEHAGQSLEDAQIEKIDRICRKLKLSPEDHLLEIGTGWGGFAVHAAKNYGCKITTTTISKQQYDFAVKRVEEAGLQDQIELLFEDYRLLEGQYDKVVSIEMIEAVGLEYLDTYFEKCSSLLKSEGQMLLQGITIRDEYFEKAKKNVDFIQRYIFPGCGIPSVGSIASAVGKNTDLQLSQMEDFGTHYARTLHHWSVQLEENRSEVERLGFSPEFYRMWQFYFSYCEGGFLERSIGVSQFLLSKRESREEEILWQV